MDAIRINRVVFATHGSKKRNVRHVFVYNKNKIPFWFLVFILGVYSLVTDHNSSQSYLIMAAK